MKSVLAKLAYKLGTPAILWRVPDSLREALAGVTEGDTPTFRLAFARHRGELAEAAAEVAAAYRPGGHLWFAYPKKSGSIRSDITRDAGWEPLAALNLLPVTQVALDEDWSALRFRLREEIKVLRRRSEQA